MKKYKKLGICLLVICGLPLLWTLVCTHKEIERIGGPYYFKTVRNECCGVMEEGSGLSFQLLYREAGKKTIVISERPFASDVAFVWRIYGSNLVYIETDSTSEPRLVLFSPKTGNTVIDNDVDYPPWHIVADEDGIKCQYLDEHLQPTNNPAPKLYSAKYLKEL